MTTWVLVTAPVSSLAQNKFFATPNRGIEGAKGNAQIKMLLDENLERSNETASIAASVTEQAAEIASNTMAIANHAVELSRMEECGDSGRLYGPGHPNSDPEGCINSLQIDETIITFDALLDAATGIKIGFTDTCNNSFRGVLSYEEPNSILRICDGQEWQEVGSAPSTGGAFINIADANLSQQYTSNEILVSGFFGERTGSVSGGASIIKNGVFAGNSASFKAGDRIALRATSASAYATKRQFAFSLSTFSSTWSIETIHAMPLIGGTHTDLQCEAAGGNVRNTPDGMLCEFLASSCPSGWSQHQNWSSTSQPSCDCSTGSHSFANIGQESCSYSYCTGYSQQCTSWGAQYCQMTCAQAPHYGGCCHWVTPCNSWGQVCNGTASGSCSATISSKGCK